MTHPEEITPASLAEAAASNCMPVGTIAWDNVKRETEKAIRLVLSASHLAKEGGEMVVVPYDDFHAAYQFVPRSKMSPDQCLKTRLRSLLRAEDLAHVDETEAIAVLPQPSLIAKGGGVVREALAILRTMVAEMGYPVGGNPHESEADSLGQAIVRERQNAVNTVFAALSTPTEGPASVVPVSAATYDVLDEAKINALPLPLIARFAGDKDWLPIHDIGVDAPLCRIDVSGKLEPRRFSEIMELKDGDGVIHNPDDFYLDADTPTEGPASQAEGMGGDAEARRKRASELMAPLMELSEGELILLRHSLPVETLARLRAALTPPETAEAVSASCHADDIAVDRFAVAMKATLAKARSKGKGGWYDETACSRQYLSDELRRHALKPDPVDVANYAMFLHQRGETIAPATYIPATEASR